MAKLTAGDGVSLDYDAPSDALTVSAAGASAVKAAVRAATAAALAANTRSGNVLTASANGALATIDGVTMVVGDRVLVKDEATGANNGIYTVTSLGSAGTPWVLTRAADFDESGEVTAALLVSVAEGTTNADSLWMLTTNATITLNTTALAFAEIGGGGGITVAEGGTPLDTDITTIDFDASDFTLTESPEDEVNVALNYGTGAGQPAEGNHAHTATVGLTMTFGDGTNVITSAELPQYAEVPIGVTVVSWKVVSVNNVSGSISFLVHRAAAGTPTTFAEISGSSDPALSAATSNEDTSIAGDWSDVTLDAGDILRVSVDGSPSSVTRVAVMLRMTRSV